MTLTRGANKTKKPEVGRSFSVQGDKGSMLVQSMRPGQHSKLYTQFATIRKQRSAYSNVYAASKDAVDGGSVIASGTQTTARISNCSTNSLWFTRWTSGCETRMGFVLKQNKAISIDLMKALIESFKTGIRKAPPGSQERQMICMGLAYSTLSFVASLRGSEGLKLDMKTLLTNLERGSNTDPQMRSRRLPPHIIIPLRGRFKGEKGEHCHLLPLSNVTSTGINI